eukprot:1448-Heterococcus_DN1.PRE.4
MRQDIDGCMNQELSQRERDIVRMRVGLDDGRAKTAGELAAIFQLSSQQILKEERSALTKLRSAPKSSSLRDYAELLSVVS